VAALVVAAAVVVASFPAPARAAVPFSFNATAYGIRALDPTTWPYYTTAVIPLVDTGVHDAAGVRMVNIGGVIYNHPVAQAQYAIANLYSYLATSDVTYLTRAEAQAQRLVDTAVASRGALYFPYPFNFKRHGSSSDVMVAPWYSAMAQGQALTVFVRLYEVTGNEAWRTAADSAYASFLNPKAAGMPWTVFVDSAGYLWLEEYAKDPPDRTYNGQTFALYGLWDYHRLTANPDALQLLRGALTTVAHYFPSIRTTSWISKYCLTHGTLSSTYHQTHLRQLLKLYTITGNVTFARNSDLLYVDYPYPLVSGTVRFAAGNHVGYRFNATGGVTATKSATLSKVSTAPFNGRQRIRNKSGSWLMITAGIWAGYWILEIPGRSYVPGEIPVLAQHYDPVRKISFAPGTYTGYTFSATGAVTGSRRATLTKNSSAAGSKRVTINGTQYIAMTTGIWAGYYIPLTTGVSY
jgi:hypothetical protein